MTASGRREFRLPAAFFIPLALVLVIAGPGCSSDGGLNPATGRLEGRIRLVPERLPARDARLLLLDPARNEAVGPAVRCDELGRFRIDDVLPGSYIPLVASGTRIVYDPPGQALRIEGGRVTRLDLDIAEYPGLAGAGLPIIGRVLDAATDAPISGAWVSIGFSDPSFLAAGSLPPWEDVTGDDGRFLLREVPLLDGPGSNDGLFPVVAVRAGYLPGATGSFLKQEFLPFWGPDGDTLAVTLRLATGAANRSLSGRVVHGDAGVPGVLVGLSLADTAAEPAAPLAGQPPGGARLLGEREFPVEFRPSALIPRQVQATDAGGAFRFEGLPPGRYRVHAAYLADDGWVSADVGRPPGPAVRLFDADVEGLGVQVLPAISLVSPIGGASVAVGSTRLTWRAVPGIDRYRVLFSRGNSFLLTEGFETSDTTGHIPGGYYQEGDRGRWAVQVYDGPRLVASSDALGTFLVAFR